MVVWLRSGGIVGGDTAAEFRLMTVAAVQLALTSPSPELTVMSPVPESGEKVPVERGETGQDTGGGDLNKEWSV